MDLFENAKPEGWRAPGPRDHVCVQCKGVGIFGQGQQWFCRTHVPKGFLPHDREPS